MPNVRDVRVKGAIGIVELEQPGDPAELRTRLIEQGVWIRPFGKIVYLTPALTIGEDELTRLTAAMARALSA
jgi:adenosylmethionine-8-amino-7-oxononanoate aminotransferase